jgi:hypothetical protein
METAMKTTIRLALLAALGAALLAIPASAESRQQQQRRQIPPTLQYQPAQNTFLNDTVTLGDEYMVRDPNAGVRGALLKNDVY